MTEIYNPTPIQKEKADTLNVNPENPKYPNMQGEILTDNAIQLLNKWVKRNKYPRPDYWPLANNGTLVIPRRDIPEFLEDLKTLRIGVLDVTVWYLSNPEEVDINKQKYNDTYDWEAPNVIKGSAGWLDYSIEFVNLMLKHYPTPIYNGSYEIMNQQVEALEIEPDLFGKYEDQSGPLDTRFQEEELYKPPYFP